MMKAFETGAMIGLVFLFLCLVGGAAYFLIHSDEKGSSLDNATTIAKPTIIPTTIATPNPLPTPHYVTCSNYHKVIDKWKTPDGSFVKMDTNETRELNLHPTYYGAYEIAHGDQYENITVGDYATPCNLNYGTDWYSYCAASLEYGKTIHLKPVTEAESGYRDACEVVQ